jgi:hypothetical protein
LPALIGAFSDPLISLSCSEIAGNESPFQPRELPRDITDVGLKNLKALTTLQTLDVEGTKITDAGLDYLKVLVKLRKLRLARTSVTDQGVKMLQQTLPNCKIER